MGSVNPSEVGQEPRPAKDSSLVMQGVLLLLMAAGFYLILQKIGLEGLGSLAIVVLGLGFVVFIHELGHFAVAKWCDVHVEAFSIGFGPSIPGCSFRRGETLYKIAWFPLGGYVKMVGEGTENEEEEKDDPRSFKNKSVWQRMAIISAGVIMNVILGFVCFIFVYSTRGVEQFSAVVGAVDPSGAAWQKGLRSGALIHQIGDIKEPYFEDLQYEVILSSAGQQLALAYELPETGQRDEFLIEPRRDKKGPYPIIGVSPSYEMRLAGKVRRRGQPPVRFESPAAKAAPGFESGDVIVGMTDPENPAQVKPLPMDPRNKEARLPDYFEYRRRLRLLAGKPVTFEVKRQSKEGSEQTLQIPVGPAYHQTLGLRMRMGQVTAIRDNSPATRARNLSESGTGVIARDPNQGAQGDIIEQVEVVETSGQRTRWVASRRPGEDAPAGVSNRDLDPLRLPDQLQDWASSIKGEKKVLLAVLRQVGHAERQRVNLEVDWDDRWTDDIEIPVSRQSPLAIPGLGLGYRVDAVVEAVEAPAPGTAANAELKRGDLIKAVRLQEPEREFGKSSPGKWLPIEPDQWAAVAQLLYDIEFKQVSLRVEREKQLLEVDLTVQPDPTWPLADRGLLLGPDRRLQKADGLMHAVSLGIERTHRSVIQIYKNLQAIVTGRVSYETMGGPILITTVAYSVASEDVYKFILFLGMISVNLAVINFLPIPILDGGHMVFLIYEKLRGAPPSEAIRVAATYAGLFLILALMVFVFWIDITRLF